MNTMKLAIVRKPIRPSFVTALGGGVFALLVYRRPDCGMPNADILEHLVYGRLTRKQQLRAILVRDEWFDCALPSIGFWRQLGTIALESLCADEPERALRRKRLSQLLARALSSFSAADREEPGLSTAIFLKRYWHYTRAVGDLAMDAWPDLDTDTLYAPEFAVEARNGTR